MNEGSHCRDLAIGEIEARHALFGPPILHDDADLVAPYVLPNQFGAGKIGTRFTAPSVAPVAKRAVLEKQSLPVFGQRGSQRRRAVQALSLNGPILSRCGASKKRQ